jgi:type IV secretion system protein VirB10
MLLGGCWGDGGEADQAPEQPVPKATLELLDFAPAPPPPPAPPAAPPPAAVVTYTPPPPPLVIEPEPPPAPPRAPEPPPFEDPGPALRAAAVLAMLAERQQARAAVMPGLATAPSPVTETEAPKPRLKDKDYSRLELEKDVSTFPVDRFRVITADRYITAVLENAINSQIPGRFIAIVERHVFGADGRLALLPKGTRIICNYESLAKVGDTRLASQCSRAIRPDGASVLLTDAAAADQVARTGLIGEVDNRTWERYGMAFMISAVSATAALGGAISDNPLAAAGAATLSQNLGQVTAMTLEKTIDLAPIVVVPAGSRIQIIPSTDIWLREPGVPGEAGE